MLQNHGQRMGAGLLLISDLQGNFIASNQRQLTDVPALQTWIDGSPRIGEGRFIVLGDKLFRCFMVPVNAPTAIAYTLIGYEITTQLLTSL